MLVSVYMTPAVPGLEVEDTSNGHHIVLDARGDATLSEL